MRPHVALATACLVLAAAAAVHADPADTRRYELTAGGMAGVTEQLVGIAGTVDGAARVGTSPVWVHVGIAKGVLSGFLDGGQGTMQETRAGAEARGCMLHGAACAEAGVDLGYEDVHFEDPANPSLLMPTDDARAIVVPRVGLDLGGTVRVRPGFEVALADHGGFDVDATLAVAYLW